MGSVAFLLGRVARDKGHFYVVKLMVCFSATPPLLSCHDSWVIRYDYVCTYSVCTYILVRYVLRRVSRICMYVHTLCTYHMKM